MCRTISGHWQSRGCQQRDDAATWDGPARNPRTVFNGILYVLRTGCQWKMVPREYGSGSTLHAYFQAWGKKGFFRKLWERAAQEYDRLKGLDWEWQAMDSFTVQAPVKGGISQGKTPPIGGR